ncbi:putative transcriptional regulator, AsnC/Lrp family (plasmid) [Sinorhizobium fredii NGR234]|uniref:Transcriptional regulator, AsnC/Lrp family n=1 Tax=Sinorhizobium fredii (strain NBRC 101917 / NGR234) TaxID=394 RepID=Q6W241_SINFN|nr:Lrp/AsnC family transcriptional regulator [Sinorhizobium fredii]AAQ87177.1 Transcriptional regulatory protein [Sinorhizobium fredii NGR234]ACP23142.1 putative transcriptional regulator, AsnC/Lrp family [Sinorhizobium fredii NGR234]
MLDQFDIRLLSAIQDNADLTNAELSELVALSGSQCARRLERLRQEGFIEKSVCVLSAKKLGLAVTAYTTISLSSHTEEGNRRLHSFIEDAPEILECYSQTGDADFLIKITVKDLDHLSAFLERMIHKAGGLLSVKSSIMLKTIKKTNSLPLKFE